MRIIRTSSIKEVFNLVSSLRHEGGVEDYNVSYLSKFSKFSLAELDEPEFWDLIFLDTWEVEAFYPESSSLENRRLNLVANIVNSIADVKLTDNWDIGEIRRKTRKFLNQNTTDNLPPIVLIPYKGGYYIQDGNHRCLGIAMAILKKKTKYKPIKVFLAIDEL